MNRFNASDLPKSKGSFWAGVVTLFPEYFEPLRQCGVVARGIKEERFYLELENPRTYAHKRHPFVDDRPYGGGAGMVLTFGPLWMATQALMQRIPRPFAEKRTRVVYLTPQGQSLRQATLQGWSEEGRPTIFICGRYEAIDERFIEHAVDEEWSVGDYVVSGGEIPALLVLDGLARLLPDVLHNPNSTHEESFSLPGRLGPPHYTRPRSLPAGEVPEVLLQGDHEAIALWRKKMAVGKTWLKRPDLIQQYPLSPEEICLLKAFQVEYLAKMT